MFCFSPFRLFPTVESRQLQGETYRTGANSSGQAAWRRPILPPGVSEQIAHRRLGSAPSRTAGAAAGWRRARTARRLLRRAVHRRTYACTAAVREHGATCTKATPSGSHWPPTSKPRTSRRSAGSGGAQGKCGGASGVGCQPLAAERRLSCAAPL